MKEELDKIMKLASDRVLVIVECSESIRTYDSNGKLLYEQLKPIQLGSSLVIETISLASAKDFYKDKGHVLTFKA